MTSGEWKAGNKVPTGDWIDSAWRGPEWTPYAEAIAQYYPVQVPWFLTKQITLTLAIIANQQGPITILTQPQLYDILIFGMSATVSGAVAGEHGNKIYMNVTHLQTGIPWVAPNVLGYAPIGAFAGITNIPSTGAAMAMPNMKLPDAFFLPKHTKLKLDFIPVTILGPINLSVKLTFIGVQLANHRTGFKTPEKITMPNGEKIGIQSRIPWFGCVPFGRRFYTAGTRSFNAFELPPGEQCMQYLPPANCEIELHDAYANFTAPNLSITDEQLFKMKIFDVRSRYNWTPELTPVVALFGNEQQANPALPFSKPHVLAAGHRSGFVEQNNDATETIAQGTLTLRGVRKCEY